MLGGTLLNFRIIFRPVSLLFCTLLCCSTGIVSAQETPDYGDTIETATTLTSKHIKHIRNRTV